MPAQIPRDHPPSPRHEFSSQMPVAIGMLAEPMGENKRGPRSHPDRLRRAQEKARGIVSFQELLVARWPSRTKNR